MTFEEILLLSRRLGSDTYKNYIHKYKKIGQLNYLVRNNLVKEWLVHFSVRLLRRTYGLSSPVRKKLTQLFSLSSNEHNMNEIKILKAAVDTAGENSLLVCQSDKLSITKLTQRSCFGIKTQAENN